MAPINKIRSVDIAVCSWNRADLLKRTLDRFLQLDIPDSVAVSFLLVDNASSDQTPAVIERFRLTCQQHVVGLNESQQGHTFARNCAVAQSTADLVLWTDDDVLVAKDWITKYVAAANAGPEFDFWGSQIVPHFIDGQPKWIDATWEKVQGCFASRDLGDHPFELDASRLPYGANFAVRGEVQRRHLFATELGRRGDLVLGEDEINLMKRLLDDGHRGQWLPDAVVEHLIPPERASRDYVFNYFVGQGRALAVSGKTWHDDANKMETEARQEYRRYLFKHFLSAPDVWVSHMIRAALAQGQAEEMAKRDDLGGR